MGPLLTDEVRSWIGREVTYTAPEELGRAAIRYFALAIGDDNPLYVDDDYARAAGYPSVIAPPTLVCETNQYIHRAPGDDGYIGHVWDLPLRGFRIIRGGHEYEFARPVLPSDRVSAIWRVADIVERTTSRGGSMLVVSSEVTYVDQEGEVLARNRETILYQPVEPT